MQHNQQTLARAASVRPHSIERARAPGLDANNTCVYFIFGVHIIIIAFKHARGAVSSLSAVFYIFIFKSLCARMPPPFAFKKERQQHAYSEKKKKRKREVCDTRLPFGPLFRATPREHTHSAYSQRRNAQAYARLREQSGYVC